VNIPSTIFNDLVENVDQVVGETVSVLVPNKGTERLRINPTPLHADEMIIELRHGLVSGWASLKLARERPTERVSTSLLMSGELTLPTSAG